MMFTICIFQQQARHALSSQSTMNMTIAIRNGVETPGLEQSGYSDDLGCPVNRGLNRPKTQNSIYSTVDNHWNNDATVCLFDKNAIQIWWVLSILLYESNNLDIW